MRLVYFGSGPFGLPTLRKLNETHEVAAVITQPDRPAGRHRTLTPTDIARWAEGAGLPVHKPERPNDQAAIEQIHALDPDAFVVIAYGHKLGPDLLDDFFAINLHASLLPKYRGAAPINWAMISGEDETGLSVITLAQRMDAGAILAQAATPIDPRETAGELHDRLAEMGPELVLRVLRDYEADSLAPQPQDESQATPAPKLSKQDATVSFDHPADAVRARVHGLNPWPGCEVVLEGRPIKLRRVAVCEEADDAGRPGEVLEGGRIRCRPGAIRVLELQPPGKRVMRFDEYARGHAVPAGSVCEGRT